MRLTRPFIALAGTLALLAGGLAGAGALSSAAATTVAGRAPMSLAAAKAELASTVGAGYWHTSGNQILDAAGNPVRVAGINWYGFETPDEIAHGLWAQDYHTIINDIAELGYNTIRIPFSNQMVEDPIVPQNLSFYNTGPINTDLAGLTSLQDLQKIVSYAGQVGLKVILDDHRSEAGESAEANGLWYTSTYTSQDWVNDWVTLAKMFANDPTVVGFDLRNEPHTPTGDTYPEGATWGTGAASTDIRLAYEQAGNAILAVNPNALIFCEGISENPDRLRRHQRHLVGRRSGRGGPVPGHAQLARPRGVLRARLRPEPVPADLVQLLDHASQPGCGVERQLGLPVQPGHRAGLGG